MNRLQALLSAAVSALAALGSGSAAAAAPEAGQPPSASQPIRVSEAAMLAITSQAQQPSSCNAFEQNFRDKGGFGQITFTEKKMGFAPMVRYRTVRGHFHANRPAPDNSPR
jgi:hypothetical protein